MSIPTTAALIAGIATTTIILLCRALHGDLVTAALVVIVFIELTSIIWDGLEDSDQ